MMALNVLLKQFGVLVMLSITGMTLLAGCGKEQFATQNGKSNMGANAAHDATPVEPASKPGKYGGTFTNSSLNAPNTFNMWIAKDASTADAVKGLCDSLIAQNPYTLKWEGHLAQLPEISRDGLTWTFHLKPNLKWSDGLPLTADDVIFTLDVIFDPKVQTDLREGMLMDVPDGKGGYKRVPLQYKKIDDSTVQFKFPVPYAMARSILSFPIAPRHKLYQSWKAGQPSSTEFNAAWGVGMNVAELVSCGPWIIQSYVPGQRIVYGRNPYYWKKDTQGRPLPYLDHYVMLIVQDYNTSLLKFRNGDMDTIEDLHSLNFSSFKDHENAGHYKTLNLGPSWGSSYICFNENPHSVVATRSPWKIQLFRDVRFRQAVSYAIDRQRISDDVFNEMATPMWGPLTSNNTLFFNSNVPKYPLDLNKAKALLAEIGLRDTDGDGILEYQGHPVKFDILGSTTNKDGKAIAAILVNNFQKIGLGATFTPMEFDSMITLLGAQPYNWDAVLTGYTGTPEPYDFRNIWESSGSSHLWYPSQQKPATPWEAETDRIFQKSGQTLDENKRRDLFNRWQTIAATELPLIYTVTPNDLAVLRDGFGNSKPCSLGGVTWNLDEIYSLKATRDTP
jgi:peptide/nickel transport system substrate-binding protein